MTERRIRHVIAALSVAAALGAAGAGAAQAATLAVDHPCYYSFGRAHEPIYLSGAGFTPQVLVNLTLLGQIYHTNDPTTQPVRSACTSPRRRFAARAPASRWGRTTAGTPRAPAST